MAVELSVEEVVRLHREAQKQRPAREQDTALRCACRVCEGGS